MTAAGVHERIEERFSAYLERELPEREHAEIEAHLAICIQCRTNLERFRTTVGALARLRRDAPATFLAGVQGQIHRRSGGRFFRRRWLLFGRIPFEWVSLVMILAMLAYYIVVQHGAPTAVTPAP